ncbi:Tn3 family transposase [Streptomyces sp. NPDC102462]|uniref:Tn3 family transposase n=1 Tax=Streptomyces sp. NPDC102462 TaxID=3366178 RepID=UPI00380784C7
MAQVEAAFPKAGPLLVGKLSASGRQNALAAALKEYGALRRTIYAARYLAAPACRRKISRQLNKGESLHALKRDLLYAHKSAVRAPHRRRGPGPHLPGVQRELQLFRRHRCRHRR